MSDHPLDPLSAEEFRAVAQILRREKDVARPHWRIASVELREPAKDVVRAFQPGDPIAREARVVAWNTDDGTAYVGVLSLTDDALLSWDAQPGKPAQRHRRRVARLRRGDAPPPRRARRARQARDHRSRSRARRRLDLRRPPHPRAAYEGRRIGWCDVWLRDSPDANPYAHPVSGLKLVVDLNTMELLEIEDTPVGRVPRRCRASTCRSTCPGLQQRTDLKPLDIRQPDGVVVHPRRQRAVVAGLAHAAGFRLPRGP